MMRLFPLHVITYSLTLNAARLYHHCYYSVSALFISSSAHRGGSSSLVMFDTTDFLSDSILSKIQATDTDTKNTYCVW